MQMKQQQLSYCFQNSSILLVLVNKILTSQDQSKKYTKFSQTLDFSLKGTYLRQYSKDLRLYKEQF